MKRNSKMITTIMVVFASFNTGFTQEEPSVYQRSEVVEVPASPNAASLGNYGDFDVSMSTGSAKTEIPIINLSEGGINIPISLAYQSSGLRVNDRPSWVGMGWMLNGIGVISRTARGRADDLVNGYLANSDNIPTNAEFNDKSNNDYYKLKDIVELKTDFIPDAFSFNFGAYGGTFFFSHEKDENGHNKVIGLDQPAFKVEYELGKGPSPDATDIVLWKITDDNGLVYYFNEIETTKVRNETASQDYGWDQEYVSAWYISSIYNPFTNTTAVFQYHSSETQKYFYEDIAMSMKFTREEESDRFYTEVGGLNTSYRRSEHHGLKYIRTISLGFNTLTFTLGSSSETSASGQSYYSLQSINWHNNAGSNKDFVFNYSYFIPPSCTGGPGCKRLRLDQFKEIGKNPKIYDFEYYDGDMPEKTSYYQDHWGYYNGDNASFVNSSLLPNISIGVQLKGDGANREPDFNSTLIGMLKTITYPTKGTTTFDYEQNTWEDGTAEDDVRANIGSSTIDVTGTATVGEVCSSSDLIIGAFNLNSDYRLKYTCHPIFSGLDSVPEGGRYPVFTVREFNTFNILTEFTISDDMTGVVDLPQGKYYEIKVCASGSDVQVVVDLEADEVDRSLLGQPIARSTGGIRLRTIENWDPVNKITQTRTFDYGFGGYLVWRKPSYYSGYWVATAAMVSGGGLPSGRKLTHVALVNSVVTGGIGPSSMPVAYEHVKEYSGDASNNAGYIIYKFTRATDLTGALLPQESKQFSRNKIMSKEYFNSSETKVRGEYYTYGVEGVGIANAFNVEKSVFVQSGVLIFDDDFNFSDFTLRSNWYPLKSKKIIDYHGDGSTLTYMTDYEYSDSGHQQPIAESIERANGKILRTEYTYPDDVTASDPDKSFLGDYSELVSDSFNARNTLLRAKTKEVDASGTSINLYSLLAEYEYDTELEIPVLRNVRKSIKDSSPIIQYTISKYNNRLKPLEIIDKNGIVTSYYWGYNNTLPIYMVQGATYDEIQTAVLANDGLTLGEAVKTIGAMATSYEHIPSVGLRSITDPNGLVTSYSYDDMGRLIEVRDDNNNLLQSYDYNYADGGIK